MNDDDPELDATVSRSAAAGCSPPPSVPPTFPATRCPEDPEYACDWETCPIGRDCKIEALVSGTVRPSEIGIETTDLMNVSTEPENIDKSKNRARPAGNDQE